tara:strand:+ start:52 stop:318 length:267 start_codon:yes stop_codon:yes gene_type:complete
MAKGAKYVTDTTAVTGSFSRLQIGGKNFGAAEFTDIQWGLGANSISGSVATKLYGDVTTNIEISGSAVIEGPICAFKLANGSVLAYYE